MSTDPEESNASTSSVHDRAPADFTIGSPTPGTSVSGEFTLTTSDPAPMLEAALHYATLGYPVFPVHTPQPDGRCSCGDTPKCVKAATKGKHPRTPNGVNDATLDAAQIRKWWKRWPDANIGIGFTRGQGALDCDMKEGNGLAEALAKFDGDWPITPTADAGGGGAHLYFTVPLNESLKNTTKKVGISLDTRGAGGYVLAPPSLHASGRRYQWRAGLALGEVPPLKLPGWMLLAKEGERNTSLTSEVGRLFHRGLDADAVLDAALAWNEEHGDPPLDPEEVTGRVESIGKMHAANGDGRGLAFEYSDKGVAERFVKHHGDDLRYVRALKRWFVWDSIRWKEDATLSAVTGRLRSFLDVEQQRAAEAMAKAEDNVTRKVAEARIQAVVKLWSQGRMQAVLAVAQTMPPVAATADQFDTDPWLLNVENGLLNLKTGQLQKHERQAMCTKLVPVAYDAGAPAPRWEAFIREIMLDDTETIRFLQRAVGLTLLGKVIEHAVLFCYGTGANGKTVFLEVLRAVLGDYACATPFRTFLKGPGEVTGNDIVRLRGARLVTASEAGEGQAFDEAKLKQVTGGDSVIARPLFGEFIEYRPQFTLWLATNYEPRITGQDEGIWRRIHQVPFELFVPEERRDPHLTTTLQEELPGILAWSVKGTAAILATGLKSPERVRSATAQYRDQQDIVGQFVQECVIRSEKSRLSKGTLYTAYERWIRVSGLKPLSIISLGKRLRQRKWEEQHSDGVHYWLDVALAKGDGAGSREDEPPDY